MQRFAAASSIIFTALLLAVPSAWARPVDWQPAAISDDHTSWLFLDRSSIVRKDKKVSVRVLLEYDQPQPGMVETNNVPYRRVRSLMSFDCDAKTLLLLEEEYLDGEQQLLGQLDASAATWDPVLPESLIEPVYDAVCTKK
ncbi:surface-adhesin E family protein [Methylogaea oryzae]|uniref:Surface-adhesin protein E-like domain-containing protein n=1 Tax=Methylogaea oryzae TaxID=1295382 RepID=A0A8D4VRL7_9GAMM|nr:surface-adhesin E family protein [Methylogaea oryzae]BBL72442.1 hypothetical protein MoryE10_30480 [Methylogaea oryzae]